MPLAKGASTKLVNISIMAEKSLPFLFSVLIANPATSPLDKLCGLKKKRRKKRVCYAWFLQHKWCSLIDKQLYLPRSLRFSASVLSLKPIFLGHLPCIDVDWPIWIQLIQNSGRKIANSKVVAPGHTFVVQKGNYSDWTPHELQLISLLPIRQAWSLIVKTKVQWGQRRSHLSVWASSPNLYIFHVLRMKLSETLAGNILWTTCVIALITSTLTHPLALGEKETTKSSELVIFLFSPCPGGETPNHRLRFTSCRKATSLPSTLQRWAKCTCPPRHRWDFVAGEGGVRWWILAIVMR